MRTVLSILLIGMLLLAAAPIGALAASGDAGSGPGGAADQTQSRIRNETELRQGDETAAGFQNQTEQRFRNETEAGGAADRIPPRNGTELRQQIRDREHQLAQETNQSPLQNREILANQNRVRLAVHALLLMKDELDGIGQNVSAIAQEFNNSVQATIRAEERIRERNAVVRFFAGGDEVAAGEIDREVIQNQERIRQMEQLVDQCRCDPDARAALREQLQVMQQEQERLRNLARQEREDKGLIGWLWK